MAYCKGDITRDAEIESERVSRIEKKNHALRTAIHFLSQGRPSSDEDELVEKLRKALEA